MYPSHLAVCALDAVKFALLSATLREIVPEWERDAMQDHWAKRVLRRTSDLAVPPELRQDIVRLCEIVQGLPHYEFRDADLADLADTLLGCADVNSIAEVMVEVGNVCGFDHANIFLLRHGEAITFNKRVCTSFPQEWLRTYEANRYQFLDPVVMRAFKGGEPFLFSDLPNSAPIVKNFWATAVAHGVGCEGCCFVFDLDLGIQMGMSFTSMGSREATAAAFEANRGDLRVLGEIACSVFVELSGMIRVDQAQLAIDELRYLKGLINTTDHAGASAILQDPHTQALQRSICYRLGVGTIFQALAVVARERWFDDLPFDSQEVAMPYPGPSRRDSKQLSDNLIWEIGLTPAAKSASGA